MNHVFEVDGTGKWQNRCIYCWEPATNEEVAGKSTQVCKTREAIEAGEDG